MRTSGSNAQTSSYEVVAGSARGQCPRAATRPWARRRESDFNGGDAMDNNGKRLLPILLVSMVLLVAAFIVLVATRAESAGVLGYGFIG